MKKQAWKVYAAFILVTEAVGALAGLIIRPGIELYKQSVIKPPLTPPALAFPIVWAILYALMGVGAARVWLSPDSDARRRGLRLFALQLAFNFLWSILFFSFRAYGFAFVWLVALWALIVWMSLEFRDADPPAAALQLPYLLWVLFAGYLNLFVWLLNR